jgi:hypothetical protein
MNQPWDHVPAWAAEFPNDNPALHEGVSWVCLAVCGPVKPIARPRSASRPPGPLGFVAPAPAHPTSAVVAPAPASVVVPIEDPVVEQGAAPVRESESNDDSPSVAAPDAIPTDPVLEAAAADPVPEAAPPDPLPEDRPPASVLGGLLERLDFELTPVSGSVAVEPFSNVPLEVLDIDASDLEGGAATPTFQGDVGPPEPFVFDGGIDSGASGNAGESAAEEVVGSALKRPERSESVAASLVDPAADARLDNGAAAEPPQAEAFRAFVAALVEVLLVSGATRAAAVVPALLESATGDPGAFDPESQRLLVAARIAEESDGRMSFSATFLKTAQAWRDVLSGETNDLSACGTSTLDGWAGELLKALGVGRDGKTDVRRELRRRGVAAFGMLLAA